MSSATEHWKYSKHCRILHGISIIYKYLIEKHQKQGLAYRGVVDVHFLTKYIAYPDVELDNWWTTIGWLELYII